MTERKIMRSEYGIMTRRNKKTSGGTVKKNRRPVVNLLRAGGAGAALLFCLAASGTAVYAKPADAQITASGIEESGVTVRAIQIVRGIYASDGQLTGYQLADSANMYLKKLEAPTANELGKIAGYCRKNPAIGVAMEPGTESGTYTADVEPGEYLILVTGSGDTIYNPAVASVNVEKADAGEGKPGSVNFTGFFREGGEDVYLKSTKPGLKKSIVVGGEKKKGITASAGTTLSFLLEGILIPSYSPAYEEPTFVIRDVCEDGRFEALQDLTVRVGGAGSGAGDGEIVGPESGAYELKWTDYNNGFEIRFAEDYMKTHGGEAVEITYNTVLAEYADCNFAENLNLAEVEYSDDPDDADSVRTISAGNYVYTFGLDALLDSDAETGTGRMQTYELNKVTEALSETGENKEYEPAENEKENYTTQRSGKALAGAGFSLYTDESMTKKAGYAESDENGHMTFTGLNAGTYYLKETRTPKRYAATDREYEAAITAVMDEESGLLKSYKVSLSERVRSGDGTVTLRPVGDAAYTCVSEVLSDGTVKKTGYTETTHPAEIVNTQLITLPSTGGRGVYGFVLAAAAMGGGLILWKTVSDRKEKG